MEEIQKRKCPVLNIFNFLKPTKTPEKLVKDLKDALTKLNKGDKRGKRGDQIDRKIWKYLEAMKDIIFGKDGNPPKKEMIQKLADEMCEDNFLYFFIQNLPTVDFESRKSIVIIYNYLLRLPQILNQIWAEPEILFSLVEGYEHPNLALNYGSMLQNSLNFEPFTGMVLNSDLFPKVFKYVQSPTFHISADAFKTLKALLTGHDKRCSEFMDENYNKVFKNYEILLRSDNYVVRWQSIKLLAEILRNKAYNRVMHKYISRCENLKHLMKLMTRDSKNIQYEAFQALYIFIANPYKTEEIEKLLLKYQENLLSFLSDFQEDRPDDPGFKEEKCNAIKILQDLKPCL